MKHRSYLPILILLTLLLEPLAAQGLPGGVTVVRYGVFVGANDGGADRSTLQWAASDARRMAQVMNELGGIAPKETVLLVQARPAEIMARLDQVAETIRSTRSPGVRSEFMFYYSGHADEAGLRIGRDLLEWQRLRAAITGVGADISIAVLDSCASGSFTRAKGGVRVQPFLVDESANMKGHAFLTSSSADELSQESDALGASFFTHYLASALRGAGDASQDGLVTLNEAYHYAFTKTLERTEGTVSGPQHASYDIQLTGTGDLVLSDLRNPQARLVLDPALEGRFYIRDAQGKLVVEQSKTLGKASNLALPTGRFTIRQDQGTNTAETSVVLVAGQALTLRASDFVSRPALSFRARGDEAESESEAPSPLALSIMASIAQSREGSDPPNDETMAPPPVPVPQEALPSPGPLASFQEALRQDLIPLVEIAGFILPPESETDGMVPQSPESLELPVETLRVTVLPEDGPETARNTLVSLAALWAREYRVTGVALSGLGTQVAEETRGAAVSGLINIQEGTVRGAGIAGLLNLAGGEVQGAQVAGLFNIAKGDVRGIQVAGLFNVSGGTVHGVQIAPFNYAARMEGIPIGLFSWIEDGIHEIHWQGRDEETQYGIHFLNGTHRWFTSLGATLALAQAPGTGPLALEATRTQASVGSRWGEEGFLMDAEVGLAAISAAGDPTGIASAFGGPGTPSLLPTGTIRGGIDLFWGLGIWFGPRVDLVIPSWIRPEDLAPWVGTYETWGEVLLGGEDATLLGRWDWGLRFSL